MEQKGLIEKIESSSDKRLKEIVFKDNNEFVKNSIKNEICQSEKQLIKNVSNEDLVIFMKVTNQMIKNLEENNE